MKKIISSILAASLLSSCLAAVPVSAEDAEMESLGVVEAEDFEGCAAQTFTETGYFLNDKVWIPKLCKGDSVSVVEEEDGNKALEIRRKVQNATGQTSKLVYVLDKAYSGKIEISFDYRIVNNNGSCLYFMTPGSSNSDGASLALKSYIAQMYWYNKLRDTDGYNNWGNTSQIGNGWVPMTVTIDVLNGQFTGSTYRNYGKAGQSEIARTWNFGKTEVPDIKYFCVAEINNEPGNLNPTRTEDAVYRIDNIKVTNYDYPSLSAESTCEGKVLGENEPATVTFNEAVSEDCLKKDFFVLYDGKEEVEEYGILSDESGKTISVIPEKGWEFGKEYKLIVKKEISAKRGKVNPMSLDFTVNFLTEDITGSLNISEGQRFNSEVSPVMTGKDGVSYSYQLKKDEGDFGDYNLSVIDVVGAYSLKIIAEKNGKTQEKTISFAVIGEVPPTAENVRIEGEVYLGSELSGKYSYNDENKDSEGKSEFRWLLADSPEGEFLPIKGMSEETVTVDENFIDKYVVFEVTPVSEKEPFKGKPVRSVALKGMFRPTAKDVVLEKDEKTLKLKYTPFDENGDEFDTYLTEWYYQTEKDGEFKKLRMHREMNIPLKKPM